MPGIYTHIDNFIDYLIHEKKLSQNTAIAYATDLYEMGSFIENKAGIDIPVNKITKEHIRSWLVNMFNLETNLPLTERTKKRKLSSVSSFFKYLMKTGKVTENPARIVKVPKVPKRLPVFLDEGETEDLLDNSLFTDDLRGKAQQMIINTLYQTGMRRSELAGLKNKDIDLYKRSIKVLGKGNKERIIPISDFLMSEIKNYNFFKENNALISSEYFLTLKSNKPISVQFIYRTVKEYMAKVSTINRKSPHVLRHTFATHLLNNGADISVIKDLLGHKSLAATQIYTHTDIDKLKNEFRKAHPRSG